MLIIGGLMGILTVLGVLYLNLNPQFGGSVNRERKEKYSQSKHWKNGKFENLSHTTMNITPKTFPGLIKKQLTNTKVRYPVSPLPIIPFNHSKFEQQPSKPKFIWYGHSVLLLQIGGKNLLIDPMLGPDASPIAPVTSKRFSENTLDLIDQLPKLDAILMTHDHYDHLDYASFQKLKDKTDVFLVALGVSKHLERWGIAAGKIKEFDWWDECVFHEIKIIFTPSRHFSGRGLTDRFKCLWGGWVFQTSEHAIYWSGDGGYDTHFKKIGEQFGPFDWVFIECGQYNKLWPQTHLFPEESILACKDAKGAVGIPVHWGGFALALHPWEESVERFVAEAERTNYSICLPKLGEVVCLGDELPTEEWYKDID